MPSANEKSIPKGLLKDPMLHSIQTVMIKIPNVAISRQDVEIDKYVTRSFVARKKFVMTKSFVTRKICVARKF